MYLRVNLHIFFLFYKYIYTFFIPRWAKRSVRLRKARGCTWLFQIFEMLWRLVCHDIWFVWERMEYLQHDNNEILCEVPFKVRGRAFY